jgi:glycosyltransferase involved in cell wall biosynthesis
VSVVVPVLDAADTLSRQLEALAAQQLDTELEFVVADNGSRDGSLRIAEAWAAESANRRVVHAARRGPGAARNAGAAAARGDFLAFCDADDMAAPGWLPALVGAASLSDFAGGRFAVAELNGSLPLAWHDGPKQDRPFTALGFLPFASGGNLGIWSDVFAGLGGFDEEILTGEDIDFSWRAQLDGRRMAFAPNAVMLRSYRSGLRPLALQHYQYGKDRAALYKRFRDHGVRRPPARKLAREWVWVGTHAPAAARDPAARGAWVRRAALRCGLLAGSLRHRVLFP